MSLTISQVLKTTTAQTLGALKGVLAKGQAHAEAIGVEESVFLNARLAPDMFPLVRQVQIATDMSARGASRLAGRDMPSFPDTETTFAELIERCDNAIAHILGTSDDAINANADTVLEIPAGKDQTMPMTGTAYTLSFIVTNLNFHATTAYGLLRSQGVAIGKRDYLMPPGAEAL
ncbi:DUF1993 domain-containing protein [Hirschia baltica]|uniref:DUF1993 domain-containing protein n=1 Tax=Hirschia baltica (strain ATCC 49814 / DSM 5838 / IFAM 1418) TaxID=582402 RepID=C6XNP8_HIRBI|nr:DUF1993 domain-containing protein [Hirschia baltica]ACT58301.1 conserved hypothetical protein [Hirschia baltica ATCC 49814]